MDARGRAARVHRLERRPVGRDHGQLRQDVVPGRRQRHARLLPDACSVRQLHQSRTVRDRSQHHLGRAGADRRHAGRHERRAHARWIAGARHRLGRQRRLSRRPPAEGHARRLLLRRGRRPHRPPTPSGEERRADAAQERLSVLRIHPFDRSALPPRRRHDCARRHDVHHRHVPRHHPGVAVVGSRHVSASAHRPVCARQDREEGTDLAAHLRGHGPADRAAEDALGDTGATGRAPVGRERLVARHRAAAARPEAGQVGGAGAAEAGAFIHAISSRGSTRCGHSRGSAPPTPRWCGS